MDVLNVFDLTLSPVSLTWVASVVSAALSIYFNILSPSKFTFATARLKLEPWRLILSFCYLGPPLMGLIQNCYFIAKTVGLLEGVYMFSYGVIPNSWTHGFDETLRSRMVETIARNKTRDFAYFVIQLGLSVALAVWCIYAFGFEPKIFLLGPSLQRVMLYIRCRMHPEEQINLMGIGVRAKYAFLASQLVEFLVSNEYFTVISMFSRSPAAALNELLRSQLVYEATLEFCVGHFWWFLRYNYLDVMYNESYDDWTKAYLEAHGPKLDFQEILRFAMTPIWYRSVANEIRKDQRLEEATAVPNGTSENLADSVIELNGESNDTFAQSTGDFMNETYVEELVLGDNLELDDQESEVEPEHLREFEGLTGLELRELE